MTHQLCPRLMALLLIPASLGAASAQPADTRPAHCAATAKVGKFEPAQDLLIAAFDSKTDTDDFHSMAALATMLADPRLACVDVIAVAGAYGKQSGDYLAAPKLFQLAFGSRWTDAHSDRNQAADKVAAAALAALRRGGQVWVQEAGQSDFTEMVVRRIKAADQSTDTRKRVTVVQHSEWNERETTPSALQYVRTNTNYVKIADGNAPGNGTPGFKTTEASLWPRALAHPKAGAAWAQARKIAVDLNAHNGGHDNKAIRSGGFDFSDAVEDIWIFGFDEIRDPEDFFATFAPSD